MICAECGANFAPFSEHKCPQAPVRDLITSGWPDDWPVLEDWQVNTMKAHARWRNTEHYASTGKNPYAWSEYYDEVFGSENDWIDPYGDT